MTRMYRFCWALWIGGTILIVASWTDVVTPTIGWIGFGVALAGTLLSFGAQQRLPPSPQASSPEDQTGAVEPGTSPDRGGR
jgi:hypothetical protein